MNEAILSLTTFVFPMLTGKTAAADVSLPVTRVELPTYYLFIVLLVMALVVWRVIKIFGHSEHSH